MAEQSGRSERDRQLQELLVHPREDPNVEYKGWLNLDNAETRAYVTRAVLALANTGGGFLVFGYAENEARWESVGPGTIDLASFGQDRLNQIVNNYADPPIHCEVSQVSHPSSGRIHPVVRVPGSHRVPIRAKKSDGKAEHIREGEIYIRKPGPQSASIKTTEEWNALIGRCLQAASDELLENIRSVLRGAPRGVTEPGRGTTEDDAPERKLYRWAEGARKRWEALVREKLPNETPSRYAHGVWTLSYSIDGDFEPPGGAAFLDILRRAKGNETGWPPWWIPERTDLEPYPYEGLIECWMKDVTFGDGAHSDFWRADPQGRMYLLRGYQEDGRQDRVERGTSFNLVLPIWRIGECLLHAERLAHLLGGERSPITVRVTWDGPAGRELVSSHDRFLREGRVSRQNEVESAGRFPAESISASLPEIVRILTHPLYQAFSFFEPPPRVIEEELGRMRFGR